MELLAGITKSEWEKLKKSIPVLEEELTNDINNLETSINELEMSIDGLETSVGNIETDIDGLETSISNLGTDVDNLETDVNNLETDVSNVKTSIGNLENLTTENKNSLVDAINEAAQTGGDENGLYEYQETSTPSERPSDSFAKASELGNLSELETDDKTSAVAAINELVNKMENGGTSQIRIATFPSTSWTDDSNGNYTQTVSVPDLLESGNYTYMLPSNLQTEEYIRAYKSIVDNSFGDGVFTLVVSSVPTIDLQIIINGVQSDAPYAAASDLVQTNANVAEVEAEVEGLKENTTPVYGLQITPLNGYAFDSNYTYINKVGRIAEIQIYIITAFDSDNTTIGNVPEEVRPKRQVWFPVFAANGGEYVGRLMITQTGDVSIVDTARKLEGVTHLNGRTMYVI